MGEFNENLTKLALADNIIMLLMKAFGWAETEVTNDYGINVYAVKDINGNIIDECDYDAFAINHPTISQVLLFGDATLELQNKEEDEALNWCDYDIKTLQEVYQYLLEIVVPNEDNNIKFTLTE